MKNDGGEAARTTARAAPPPSATKSQERIRAASARFGDRAPRFAAGDHRGRFERPCSAYGGAFFRPAGAGWRRADPSPVELSEIEAPKRSPRRAREGIEPSIRDK